MWEKIDYVLPRVMHHIEEKISLSPEELKERLKRDIVNQSRHLISSLVRVNTKSLSAVRIFTEEDSSATIFPFLSAFKGP